MGKAIVTTHFMLLSVILIPGLSWAGESGDDAHPSSHMEVDSLEAERRQPLIWREETPALRTERNADVIRVGLPATEMPDDFETTGPKIQSGDSALHHFAIRTGYAAPASDNLLPDFSAARDIDGQRVLRVELHSPSAEGLRLEFENLSMLSEIELRIYDPTTGKVLGPFSSGLPSYEGKWWTPTIFGETIGLEFTVPAHLEMAELALPEVSRIMYIYCGESCLRDSDRSARALSCHNDITCHSSWANGSGRAVGRMSFARGNSNYACSGALLNRSGSDRSPLFMTANHCISTESEARSLEVYWDFETGTCNGTPPSMGSLPRTLGATLAKRHSNSDWSLLGLLEPPHSTLYLGWRSASWTSGESAIGIHHPAGSHKRISFGESHRTNYYYPAYFNGDNSFWISISNARRVRYSNGTTQGGSSGSPIFDSQGRVRGTLAGGSSGCPDGGTITKYYGRLYSAFDNLRYYLSDIASPVYVNRNVSGDAGNDGDTERGTSTAPFNRLREATIAVATGDEIRLRSGHYSENVTIWRSMTLNTDGSGPVVIGTQ